MSIERFSLEHYQSYTTSELELDPDGDWVTYDDYKTLEATYHDKEEEIKELKARISDLRFELECVYQGN